MKRRTRRVGRHGVTLVAGVLALAAASGCQPLFGRPGQFDPHAITDFAVDGYGYDWQPTTDRQGGPVTSAWDGQTIPHGVVTVSDSSSEESGNSRHVIPVLASTAQQDEASCVTILGPLDGSTQPGVALRIRSDGSRTRAITVTNNILWGARNGFNVHLADSGAVGEEQMHGIAGYFPTGFAPSLRSLPPLPWRLCARVMGQQLQTKVWAPFQMPEPSYADSRFGLAVTLPPEWVFAGRPGFYVGHLATGASTALGIGGLEQTQGPAVVPTGFARRRSASFSPSTRSVAAKCIAERSRQPRCPDAEPKVRWVVSFW